MARPSCLFLFFFIFIFLIVNLLISATCKAESKLPKKKHVTPLFFIFGDSILDAGNNNYINTTTLDQANFWPYGETFFKYPTGRFSDGRLVSDFIAEYADMPLIPPFLQPGIREYFRNGVNFASAGAGALVETFQGDVIGLKTQLSYYKEVDGWLREKSGNDDDDEGTKMTRLSRGVYLFSIGINDYTSLFLTNNNNFTLLNTFSQSTYVAMVIGNLTTVIKEIYKRGGRKFAFMNVPDLGCLPTIRMMNTETNGICLEKATMLANSHNKALSNQLFDLQRQLKGFKYSLFDMNSFLRKRINHPSKYGFKEGKAGCCGTGPFRGVLSCGGKRPVKGFELCENPNEYVFWDSIHVTEMTNQQMAKEMWNGGIDNSHVIGSYNNLKKLFSN